MFQHPRLMHDRPDLLNLRLEFKDLGGVGIPDGGHSATQYWAEPLRDKLRTAPWKDEDAFSVVDMPYNLATSLCPARNGKTVECWVLFVGRGHERNIGTGRMTAKNEIVQVSNNALPFSP